ncbi:MAG: helix-turn-helix transcriptional regulator [Pseudomonadota bacterium]
MSGLDERLKKAFEDAEYRHAYWDDFLNTLISTQIKVLREQRRWTQADLAEKTGMKQSRISMLENVNYAGWSLKTLKKIAEALDVALMVRFDSFGTALAEISSFNRKRLERPSFDEDPIFQGLPPSVSPLIPRVLTATTQRMAVSQPSVSPSLNNMATPRGNRGGEESGRYSWGAGRQQHVELQDYIGRLS